MQAGVLGCGVVAAASALYEGDFQQAADQMVHPDVEIEPNMENHKKYEKIFDQVFEVIRKPCRNDGDGCLRIYWKVNNFYFKTILSKIKGEESNDKTGDLKTH